MRRQHDERDLGPIGLTTEHRLAIEHAPESDPVEPSRERTLHPHLDRMGRALLVEVLVGATHRRHEPGADLVPSWRGTFSKDLGKGSIERDLVVGPTETPSE